MATLHQALGAFCQDRTSSAELVEIRVRGTVRLGGPRGHSISVTSGRLVRCFGVILLPTLLDFSILKIPSELGVGARRSFFPALAASALRIRGFGVRHSGAASRIKGGELPRLTNN